MRFDWLYRESGRIAELFAWHVWLSVIPVVIGLILALPLGSVSYTHLTLPTKRIV